MEELNRCPECSAEMERDGSCPACMLRLGLSGAIPPMEEAMPEPEPIPRPVSVSRRRLPWKWPAAIVALLAVVGVVAGLPRGSEAPRGPVIRFTISAPNEEAIEDFAVSPDGRKLAFTTSGDYGPTKLWIRELAEPESRELAGIEGATAPFWSPDSRVIGFFADGKLKRVEFTGGTPMTLADAPVALGASWSPQRGILFVGGPGGAQMRVNSSGGEVTRSSEVYGNRWPSFLPDGVSFLSHHFAGEKGVYVGNLDSGASRRVIEVDGAIYSEGHLLYERNRSLLAQPFDPFDGTVKGESVPIRFAGAVGGGGRRTPAFSAGAGVLAFRNSSKPARRVLNWLDRSGRAVDRLGEPTEEGEFSLSPDGRLVAFTSGGELWIRDLARGTVGRLTFDRRDAASPLWSPDGSKIVFAAGPDKGITSLQVVSVNGSGSPQLLLTKPQAVVPEDWSRDGRFLVFTQRDQEGKETVSMLPMEGDRKPTPLLQGANGARLSPDGRWLAYVSQETGRKEVYIQSFPPGNGKWMISNQGGARPEWRHDGKELYYLQSRQLMATEIRGGPTLETSAPQPLMEMPDSEGYAVSPDGQRFLVSMPLHEGPPEPIHVILNWTAEVQR